MQIPIVWPDVDELPVYRANQFILQSGAGPLGGVEDVILTLGYCAPPLVFGTREEQQTTARALGAVNAKALSRVAMSPASAQQLLVALSQHLEQIRQQGQAGQ